MCLYKKEDFIPTEEGIGYKWVTKWEGNYYSSNNGEFQYNKTRESIAIDVGQGMDDIGFHIFDSLDDALGSKWADNPAWSIMNLIRTRGKLVPGKTAVLLKVKYRHYHTGYGDGLTYRNRFYDMEPLPFRMIVAKRMEIIGEIDPTTRQLKQNRGRKPKSV